MLRVKLRYLDEWNEARRTRAEEYARLLHEMDLLAVPTEADYARHVYHLYVVRCQRRDELLDHLRACDIVANIHYPVPVHLQEAYRDLEAGEGSLPVAELCAQEVLSLPMYPGLDAEAMTCVVEAIREFQPSL